MSTRGMHIVRIKVNGELIESGTHDLRSKEFDFEIFSGEEEHNGEVHVHPITIIQDNVHEPNNLAIDVNIYPDEVKVHKHFGLFNSIFMKYFRRI